MGEVVIVPRNFVLLEELERAEKGNTDMYISYGLLESDDISLSRWQCTILGAQDSPVADRLLSLTMVCGPEYPRQPPSVVFQSKVNFPFVGPHGDLDWARYTGQCQKWIHTSLSKELSSIEGLLKDLRAVMAKPQYRKLTQPPDGCAPCQ